MFRPGARHMEKNTEVRCICWCVYVGCINVNIYIYILIWCDVFLLTFLLVVWIDFILDELLSIIGESCQQNFASETGLTTRRGC